MTKFQKIALAAAFTLAIFTAFYQTKRAHNTLEEEQQLRKQQAQSAKQITDLKDSLANERDEVADLLAENSRLRNNSNEMELLKLRGEVTRLRPLQDDVVALQKMLQQSSAGLAQWKTNELTDAGRATPIDALQSYLYSSQNTNAAKIQSGIVGDDIDPPTPEALQDFIKHEIDHPDATADTDIMGYKILSQTWLASDKVSMELQMITTGGIGMSAPFTLRKVDGEWKLVTFNIRDSQGKVNRLEFIQNPPFP
jgi:hypothetical protein